MYPNPQDALPLPPRPNVEQYRKLAKDLVKACASGDPSAIRGWAETWIRTLASLHGEPAVLPEQEITARVEQVDEFARSKLRSGDPSSECKLTDAQFVIARAHGFSSWPPFVEHIESLARKDTTISAFEAAVEAIVAGDITNLRQLLREQPSLATTRSTREHRATLLHYVSANGVENYRQVSPKNIANVTEVLLEAGADVDAEADVYGGGCTPLGLVATSGPPAVAGVQQDVIEVLLRHGASVDRNGAGNRQSLVRACLANGQPAAAAYLLDRGAPIDLPGAAGLGRLDLVKQLIEHDRDLVANLTSPNLKEAFAFACYYSRTDVVDFFLSLGFRVDEELHEHGKGHTGLHVAAFHGHVDVVQTLLRHGARVDVIDKTWGTPPLIWALTGWSRRSDRDASRFYDVVTQLIGAGAPVRSDLLEWDKVREDPQMLAALRTAAPR